ncbi:MAG: hypothetical protein MMC33_005867 [Icmadophila ericetorum]|nr:hypothetical protein [Icmadophila ericetorum]
MIVGYLTKALFLEEDITTLPIDTQQRHYINILVVLYQGTLHDPSRLKIFRDLSERRILHLVSIVNRYVACRETSQTLLSAAKPPLTDDDALAYAKFSAVELTALLLGTQYSQLETDKFTIFHSIYIKLPNDLKRDDLNKSNSLSSQKLHYDLIDSTIRNVNIRLCVQLHAFGSDELLKRRDVMLKKLTDHSDVETSIAPYNPVSAANLAINDIANKITLLRLRSTINELQRRPDLVQKTQADIRRLKNAAKAHVDEVVPQND